MIKKYKLIITIIIYYVNIKSRKNIPYALIRLTLGIEKQSTPILISF